jgi:hypothetical protein
VRAIFVAALLRGGDGCPASFLKQAHSPLIFDKIHPDVPTFRAESGDDDSVFFIGETLPRVVYALLRRR